MARRSRHRIALVALDNNKTDLIEWAEFNRSTADHLISSPLFSSDECSAKQ